jgi:MoaA/NifB/PqqE/SkfB family radical SAM enzyme
MRKRAVFPAWNRILQGYPPFLSIEITRECPLHCPGCYAYEPNHLGEGKGIRALADRVGEELISEVLRLVGRLRPLHVSFVGGEPLLRHRELTVLIRELDRMGIEVQVVTSAVLPIPREWLGFSNLHLSVSVDGLPPEHDARRAPATYDRILRNVGDHAIIVHCTIVPKFLARADYLEEFVEFWSGRENVTRIWFSLFTPQHGEYPPERLSPEERARAIELIAGLARSHPKVHAPRLVLDGFRRPPGSPAQCIFAQVTHCVSSDLATPVVPCQIGGRPECSECGCLAGAGVAAFAKVRLAGLVKVSDIFALSKRVGARRAARRQRSGQARRGPA